MGGQKRPPTPKRFLRTLPPNSQQRQADETQASGLGNWRGRRRNLQAVDHRGLVVRSHGNLADSDQMGELHDLILEKLDEKYLHALRIDDKQLEAIYADLKSQIQGMKA